MSEDCLYRAEDTWYSVSNEWGEHDHSQFVLLTARKRYACPTEKEALESLVARRERQESIYLARASRARETIERAKSMLGLENSWLR
jgi:hypothetical protein